jgi:hypothetical protein
MFLTADEVADLTGLKRPKAQPNFAALGSGSVSGKRKYASMRAKDAGWRVAADRARRAAFVLPLDQLRGLPEVDDRSGAGVYFMWHGPALVYVGQSNCIADRMSRHRDKQRSRTTWLAFDHDALRRGVECDHVRRYRPQFNMTAHG